MDLVLRCPLFFDPFSHLIPVPGAAVCSKQAVPAKPLSPGGQTLAERDVLGALTGPLARRSVQFGGGGYFGAVGSVARQWNRRVSAGLRAVKALSGFIYLRAKALEQGGFHSSERKRRKRSGLRGPVLV